MTELGTLFLVVLAVYVVQCICWVSPDSAVFVLNFRGRGKRKGEGFVWSALDIAAFFANPFPPLSPLLVTHWPGFQLNPDSILFIGSKGETVAIPWEKLVVSHSGPKLLCNGTRVFKGDETQIQSYSELLQQIRQAKRAQREQIIQKWLRTSVNMESAARRVKVFHRRSLWLKVVSNLQFFFLFLLLPLAITAFVPRILWLAIFTVVATSILIAVDFWSLHRELLAKAKDARFKSTLTIMLSPISAIRACDPICHDLVANYHPVAVAGAICPDAEFAALAGEHLRGSKFGVFANQWYQKKLQDSIERVVRQRGLEMEQLLVPAVQTSGCVLYCPRCLAQYVTKRAECADCGYETLTAFNPNAVPVSD